MTSRGQEPRRSLQAIGTGTLARIAWPGLAGLFWALSLPPFGIWPLGPLGAAVLYRSLNRRPAIDRLQIGFVCGVCQFAIGLLFIVQFTGFGYAIAVAIEALFLACGALLSSPTHARVLSFTAALTLAEWARLTWPFGGLPIGSVGLGQAGSPLGQAARLSGTLLVCALVYLLGASLSAMLSWPRRAAPARPVPAGGRRSRRVTDQQLQGLLGLAVVIALLAAAENAPRGAPAGEIAAAAIQGGGPRGLSQIEVPTIDALARTVHESEHVPAGTKLVLWPEDTVPLGATLSGEPAEQLLEKLARSLQVTIIAGATKAVPGRRFLNEVLGVGPNGKVFGRVEKVHPVPFGEYVPLRGLLRHLVNLSDLPLDAVPGRVPEILASRSGILGVLISYESFFPALARASVRAGARAILLPTNTASYQTNQIPAQAAASRLVAIATGRDVLQAATVGYSAFIDPGGAVHRLSRLGAAQQLAGALGLRSGQTPYDRLGELPLLVLALLSLCGVWLVGLAHKTHPSDPAATGGNGEGPEAGRANPRPPSAQAVD